MLTRKQRELLDFISEYQIVEGVSPSFEEMKDALGLKSKSGVHRLIAALEERDHIRRIANRARCIEIVERPALRPSPKRAPNERSRPAHPLLTLPAHVLISELQRRGVRLRAA